VLTKTVIMKSRHLLRRYVAIECFCGSVQMSRRPVVYSERQHCNIRRSMSGYSQVPRSHLPLQCR